MQQMKVINSVFHESDAAAGSLELELRGTSGSMGRISVHDGRQTKGCSAAALQQQFRTCFQEGRGEREDDESQALQLRGRGGDH